MRTRWKVALGVVAVIVVLAVVVAFFLDEPIRRYTEKQMNAGMKGYTAQIGKLNFHPFGFSIDFYDVIFRQDAHPDPPVMKFTHLSASVQWTALIHGRLVADFLLDQPVIYMDRTHFVKELEDPTPVRSTAGSPRCRPCIRSRSTSSGSVTARRLTWTPGRRARSP